MGAVSIYDQQKPPEKDPLDARNTWLKPGSFGERVWWFALIAVGVFVVVCVIALIAQKADDADAAANGWKVQGTGAVEDTIGTDLVRGHTTGFFVDKGDVIDVNGVRIRVETTNWGELSFWSGRELSKGTYCAKGTNTQCRFGVWWGKFKAVQSGPVGLPSNTEYLKVRVRCNYQRECSQHDRTWGRFDPEPREDPFDTGWTGATAVPSAEQPG